MVVAAGGLESFDCDSDSDLDADEQHFALGVGIAIVIVQACTTTLPQEVARDECEQGAAGIRARNVSDGSRGLHVTPKSFSSDRSLPRPGVARRSRFGPQYSSICGCKKAKFRSILMREIMAMAVAGAVAWRVA